MTLLSRRHLLLLHELLLAETGGADGIRDEGLLDAALESPYGGWHDEEFYPGVEAKAARLAFGLVANHPFIDGNKRIGVLAMLVLLDLNGVTLDVTDGELVRLGMSLAQGEADTHDVLNWIHEHTARA